jgi:hypothetical protein
MPNQGQAEANSRCGIGAEQRRGGYAVKSSILKGITVKDPIAISSSPFSWVLS